MQTRRVICQDQAFSLPGVNAKIKMNMQQFTNLQEITETHHFEL
jgi:hypothetical protein